MTVSWTQRSWSPGSYTVRPTIAALQSLRQRFVCTGTLPLFRSAQVPCSTKEVPAATAAAAALAAAPSNVAEARKCSVAADAVDEKPRNRWRERYEKVLQIIHEDHVRHAQNNAAWRIAGPQAGAPGGRGFAAAAADRGGRRPSTDNIAPWTAHEADFVLQSGDGSDEEEDQDW